MSTLNVIPVYLFLQMWSSHSFSCTNTLTLFICNKVLFMMYTLKKVEAENAKNQMMLNTTQLFKTSAQKHGIYICYATHVC